MRISIVTEAPAWYIILCLLAGVVYAGVLYFRDRRLNELARWLIGLLASFRFITVCILAFLLMSPLLKTVSREVEKPVVVIAQDVSESIILSKDSAYYKEEYRRKLDQLIEELSDKYQVRTYSFGDRFREGIDTNWRDKQTDFTALFDEIDTRYNGRNLGAVVVASDGLFNQGQSPISAAGFLKAPLFSVALGDTSIRRDLILNNVLHNKIAFLGNTFPIEVVVEAHRCVGSRSTLTVTQGNQVLASQPVTISSDPHTITIPFQLQAKSPGLQRYRISLSTIDGEQNLRNNSRDIVIDVLDARQKIVIIGANPHPDIGALKQTIETNDNYEVQTFTLNDFNQPVGQYSLAILHSIPSGDAPAQKLVTDLAAAGIPVFFITGVQSQFSLFNQLRTGLMIQSNGDRANDCEAVVVKDFPLFNLDEKLLQYISEFPAAQAPFATFQSSAAVTPLFRQKIGSLQTDYPLWVFSQSGNRKLSIFAGEGLWRWRLRDYADHGNNDIFNELIGKTVQYLSVRVDKSFFNISTPSIWNENQQILFDAEVYNESYELITTPEVSLTITNLAGKQFPYTFTKTASAYRLNAGLFAPGDYSYEGRVNINGKVYTKRGSFSVTPLVAEVSNLTANHQLLYTLAKTHNGEMIAATQLEKLSKILNSREDIRPVIYNPQKLNDLITRWWVFALLVLFLAVEWLLRKRNGAY